MSKEIIILCDDELDEVASVPSKGKSVGDHEFLPKKPKPILVSSTEGPTWLRHPTGFNVLQIGILSLQIAWKGWH